MKRRDWTEGRAKVDREGKCRMCPSRDGIQAAHIVPRSLGGEMESLDFVPLCQSCHSKFDRHEIDLLPALTFAEQGRAASLIGLENARIRLCPSEYRS